MSVNNRRKDQPGQSLGVLWVALSAGALIALLWGSVSLGHRIEGTSAGVPSDPFELIIGLFTGRVEWPSTATWLVVLFVVALGLLVGAYALTARSGRKHRTRVDGAARYLGTGRDIEALGEKAAKATAQRLGVVDATGVPIGNHLLTAKPLFGSWEDMHIDIWGPRTGKTTSRAVPAILAAPGACLVTSNKRDIVDATRGVRAPLGPVWVFDPQGIANEPTNWYWDPLSYVTDEVRAAKLAEHFASGSREPGAKGDAYFDPAGQDLLAGLLLAAALDGRPITDVYAWLTRPTEAAPVGILEDHGFTLMADQVAGVVNAPDKQRGGIYGTAQQMANCLTNRTIVKWITREPNETRAAFDPQVFVRGMGTLYSLSKEGKGTAGPLVTALTVAVVEAAEELATRSAGGRLARPLLGVLDEAANVCRWRTLPDLYSHYGSRGIILMTILQSWSQGVDVWGESGMTKLWSAANVAVYGGGVKEDKFLETLSRLVGDHDRVRTTVSTSAGTRSVSQSVQRERTLDIEQLSAMPKGRAIVLSSGSRATLIRTMPWMRGSQAEAVRESIMTYDPQGSRTIEDGARELTENEEALSSAAAWERQRGPGE
ncbi:type IV secretory system conjugative DNA transfer family protein [Pseudoclavibacter sp. RFBA6]|uniref:type IV secretory system conjugative DNA transfer family protein n=1 Tax=Pseudoclavibacter sp. RFBA6 TaxID=2080573 RepID=UPI000CE7A128|nr:TraM recognition domain-containing protein [Pseudoclavibacter sp. RFBA6]PPG43734.1 conjugal transfer protein [Pseudoclavibacter sp. RFBA6]